jgi:hypothetical protein
MKLKAATLLSATALLAGCATTPALVAPEVPAPLRPPVEQSVSFVLMAEGVQIYECAAATGKNEWAFKGPEAALTNREGRPMGKHYGGPTWEAPDGSTVVAEVKGRADAQDPNAIPLLLLRAKHTTGNGMFTKVRSIQRLETVGGKAPSQPCTKEKAAQVERVPYKAAYYFYVDKV